MAKVVGDIAVTVGADVSGLERGMDRANRKVKQTGAQFEKTSKRMQASAARLTKSLLRMGAAATGVAVAARQSIIGLDKIGKTAAQIGLTAESLQELHYGATSAGLSLSALDSSMERFSKRLGEAANGTGAAKRQLEEWGLSAEELSEMGLDAALDVVADRMENIVNPTERAAAAAALFGREGVAMVNMLRDGSRGLDTFRKRAREAGAVIENDVIKAAEDLEDQLGTTTLALKREFQEALVAVGPVLISTANLATGIANSISQISGAIKTLYDMTLPMREELGLAPDSATGAAQNPDERQRDKAAFEMMAPKGEISNTGVFLTDPVTGEIVTVEELTERERKRALKVAEARAKAMREMTQNAAYTLPVDEDPEVAAAGGRHSKLLEMEQDFQDRLYAIREAARHGNLQSVLSGGAEVLDALGDMNKKALKGAQVLASGEALINAYRAAAQTLADPTLPFFAKFSAAASVLAQGISFVSAIKGAGSGSGGGAGGASSASAAASFAAPSPLLVRMEGFDPNSLYSGQQFQDTFERLQDEAGDRGLSVSFA